MDKESLILSKYSYELPKDRIPKYPLRNRSQSKLLHYDSGSIHHRQFSNLADVIPKHSLLVFNDTKVIPARLFFYKKSGARIEVFLLKPTAPSLLHEEAMLARGTCTWQVMIGNAKKWKLNTHLSMTMEEGTLDVERTAADEVVFTWHHSLSFSEILANIGRIPLPPYMEREAEASDEHTYQTVYSRTEGAVAAPTAGLHFTTPLLEELSGKGIPQDYLTLHVSAGTFQPIKADHVQDHKMHQEQVVVSEANVLHLLDAENIIAVGTTSMRTLESLYWYGNLLGQNPQAAFHISQHDPYGQVAPLSKDTSLSNVLAYMRRNNLKKLTGHTEIFIYPGYKFGICCGLITNFHLPSSTLILLVAAFIGEDWRKVYQAALENGYRFLSYGDSSLLIPNR